MFYLLFMYGVTIVRGRRSSIRQLFRRFAFVCVCVCVVCVVCVCVCDDESTVPHLNFACFWLCLKKEKLKSQKLKKISYEPHRNLLEAQTGKNLLRKWSRFCKNIL